MNQAATQLVNEFSSGVIPPRLISKRCYSDKPPQNSIQTKSTSHAGCPKMGKKTFCEVPACTAA